MIVINITKKLPAKMLDREKKDTTGNKQGNIKDKISSANDSILNYSSSNV